MLLDYIVDACYKEYQQASTGNCIICSHPIECPGNCKSCLDQVHFPNRYVGKKEYDCLNMLNLYVCNYSHKYCSEIEYALNEVENLKNLKEFNVMSIGCGASPDLMALEYYKHMNNLTTPINYMGYDKNNLWTAVHEKIKKYGNDNSINVDFNYVDAIEYFREYYVSGINLLFLQYVISYFYNTGQIRAITSFFDDLIDIVLHKEENEDFIIIINDVNSCYRGRDYFVVLYDKLKEKGFSTNAKKRYFDYNIVNDYQRYGEPYNSIYNLHDIPIEIRQRYNPAVYCSSAQLIIEVKGCNN